MISAGERQAAEILIRLPTSAATWPHKLVSAPCALRVEKNQAKRHCRRPPLPMQRTESFAATAAWRRSPHLTQQICRSRQQWQHSRRPQRQGRRPGLAVRAADLPLPAVNWTRSPNLQQCLFIDRQVRLWFAGILCKEPHARCKALLATAPLRSRALRQTCRHAPWPCISPLPPLPFTPSLPSPRVGCRTDTVRARFAVGLLERIAAWRGCSRSLQGYSCGLEAAPGTHIEWSTQAALFTLAAGWRLRPHLFTSARQDFEPDDVDRWVLDAACWSV